MDDLSGYKRPTPEQYEPPPSAIINTPGFNPFAALGLDPATATATDIRPAYIRSLRHRHENAAARFPATATHFPLQVEVQHAYEYLSSSPARIAIATTHWGYRHQAVFFPQHPVGDERVFRPAAAAAATPVPATPAAAPRNPATPTATATATGASSGSGSGSGTRGVERDPVIISDDDDDEAPATATATPSPETRVARTSAAVTHPRARPDSANAQMGHYRPRPRMARTAAHRSGGSSHRNAAIANPVLGERITVGTWVNAPGAAANAVVAGFDRSGRLFYRITNEDLHGNPVAAATATATRFENINLRGPYQNMTADQVRIAIDQHLRLHPFARP